MEHGGQRILVVEDDGDLSGLICLTLEAEGYDVVAAPNGAVALTEVERHGLPRVILLDLMMPVMDGVEFVQRLRESFGSIPGTHIVVMTARGDVKACADRLQAHDILGKPFDINDLLSVVARHAAG